MALVKHNNNSISAVTSMASLSTGSMTLISEQTASASASISFTTGIDSTYPIYKFEFINIHPSSNATDLEFNFSTDSGSNYNVTKTTTFFRAYHYEVDSDGAGLAYIGARDLAQITGYQDILNEISNQDKSSGCGGMYLYNPSSTTFVKHWISNVNMSHDADYPASVNWFTAGYGNTTSAVDAIQFKMNTGNIDAGTITLYGIN